MSSIPNKIENLVYSRHAKLEWMRDEWGIIRCYPKHFIKTIPKKIIDQGDSFKAHYRYCDRTDLVLVISKVDNIVITNYRTYSNNKGNYRGQFVLEAAIKQYERRAKRAVTSGAR